MPKTSTQLSVKMSETVRGYEIRRLPLGEYLRAIDAIREMPQAVMEACFPEMDAIQMLAQIKRLDREAMTGMMMRMAAVVPEEAVKLLSILTGVEEERLINDPDIGLDGAMEMLEAAWTLNGIENFIKAAERMAAQVKTLREKTGSNG